MPAMTRGPLPARVYWVRRLLVLGTALLLVVGIARLLDNSSDASSDADESAGLSAGAPASSGTVASSSGPTSSTTVGKPGKKDKKDKQPTKPASQKPVLAAPVGICADDDIAVTPEVDDAVAGRDVMIALQLRTLESAACTWPISPDSLTISVTSGKDAIWSTRECPRAIPVQDVVVRSAVTTTVELTWPEARRSDESCSRRTEWAGVGWYHVIAASLSGEPSDVQFELETPTPVTITKTRKPKPSPSSKPSDKPKASPSGAVEPD